MAGTNMGILSRDISFPGGLLVLVEFPHIFRNKSGSLGFRFPDGQKIYNLSKQTKNSYISYIRCHSHSVSFWLGPCLWWFPKCLLPSRHNEIVVARSQPAAKGLSQVNHQLGNDWRVTPATGPNYETYDPFDSKKIALFRDQENFCWPKHIKM